MLKKLYTDEHAGAGIKQRLPKIETWKSQFANYEITIEVPEFTSVCPRTGLPDFGHLTVCYLPNKLCVELKSFKYYILGYRNLGIFYENAANRILKDLVKACQPKWMMVRGEFNVRGGMKTTVEARYPKKR
ncbi:MAG: preQ(1) synthase [candidate division WOR-3 bacterium]|nr:preQ(1) synthase [candidate division WOR-3 bacterium]MDH5683044.1 preQ(1) synthase [candidate division WOR-3 bacterium]